jgi:hypothetical protein
MRQVDKAPASCAEGYGFSFGVAFCNVVTKVCASAGACTLFSVMIVAALADLP